MKLKVAFFVQLAFLGAVRIGAQQGNCPAGFIERDKYDCYKFDLPVKSYSQARQSCKQEYPQWTVDLAVFDSQEESDWVVKRIKDDYSTYPTIWVGVYHDEFANEMKYVDGTKAGTVPKDVKYMEWTNDLPNGAFRYAAFGQFAGKFFVADGNVETNFVCELKQIQSGKCDEKNGWRLGPDGDCHKLAIFPFFENFYGAQGECSKLEATMVSIKDNATNFHVYNLPPLTGFYPPVDIWIGGKTKKRGDEVIWTWLDGTELTYTDWATPEEGIIYPNNSDAENYCIRYRWRSRLSPGRWETEKCSGNLLNQMAQAWCSRPLVRCLSDWKENDKICYFLVPNRVTWDSAQSYCNSLQARLVVPYTTQMTAFLRKLLSDFSAAGSSYVWIGLSQQSKGSAWTWVNNTQVPQSFWNTGEQEKQMLNRGCAAMNADRNDEYWSSTSCKDSYGFICEVSLGGAANQPDAIVPPTKRCEVGWTLRNRKFCYLYQAVSKDWAAARSSCKALGADLVQIKTDEEQHGIMGLAITDSKSEFWIGLTRQEGSDQYMWRDEAAKELTFTNWDDINKNTISSGLCGIAFTPNSGRQAGRWDMRDCASNKPYMCIKEATLSAVTTTAKPSADDAKYCGGNGWEADQYSSSCYQYHIDGDTTWEAAQFVCNQNGGNIVSIWDPTERAVIQAKISRTFGVTAIWIGLNQLGSAGYFSWADGSPVAYFNWNKGQPNFNAGQCVKMAAETGVWSMEECTAKYGYICKKPKKLDPVTTKPTVTQQPPPGQDYVCKSGYVKIPGTMKCITLILKPTKYDAAKSSCVSLGGNLATIDNVDENTLLLAQFYGVKKNAWIGLEDTQLTADEMYFKWVDGSTVKYTNWQMNEPLNSQSSSGERQDCVFMSASNNGRWNDDYCSTNLDGYFCSVPAKIGPVVTLTPPVGCPHHSDIFPAATFGSYCYYFSWQQTLNQQDALSQCKSFGGLLVSILDQQEQTFLAAEMLTRGYEMQFYTGLYGNRDGSTWSDGSRVTFYNFAPSVVLTASYVCGTIGGGGEYHGLWYTTSCSAVLPYICKSLRNGYTVPTTVVTTPQRDRTKCTDLYPKDPVADAGDYCYVIRGGTTYLANTYQVTFSKASSNCRQLGNGASLATIQNTDLNNMIFQSANNTNFIKYALWIGLSAGTTEQGFQWADGDAFYYNNFAPGQPSLTTKACAYMNTNGLWYTSDCNQYRNYVCMVYKPDYYVNATTRPLFTADPEADRICGGGGNWALNDETCYWVSNKVYKNWYNANSYCLSLNATLTSILSEQEQSYLTYVTSSYVASELSWTGLNELDHDRYKWVDGSALSYVNWDQGQPNDEYGAQLCVAMRSSTGKWIDEDCTVTFPFICKKWLKGQPLPPTQPPSTGNCPPNFHRFGSKCYYVNTAKPVDADTARNECTKLGRGIFAASVLTMAEQNFLISLMRGTKAPVWIGLVNKRQQSNYDYRWVSEEQFTFDNWANNQPPTSIVGPTYNCVAMRNETTQVGRWYEESCTRQLHYACSTYLSTSYPINTDGCKPGFTRSGNSCWQISTSDSDVPQWYDAPNRCATSQSDLATISDVYDQAFLDSQLASLQTSKNVWVGLSTVTGVAQWISGWPVLFTNWNYNQPTISDRYPCGYLNTTTGKWFVGACNQPMGYICRDTKTFNDQPPAVPDGDVIDMPGSCPTTPPGSWMIIGSYCYFVNVTISLPFSSAVTYCLNIGRGATIASVPGQRTNDILYRMIEQQFEVFPRTANNPWIGYVQSGGSLESIDGSGVTFVNWQNGIFPETSSSEPECVLVDGKSSYWLLESCAASRSVVCRQPIPVGSTTTTTTTKNTASTSRQTIHITATRPADATEPTTSGDSTLTILLIVGAVFGVISGVAMLVAIYLARAKPHIMPQWFVKIFGKSNADALVGDKPMGMENEVYTSSSEVAAAAPDAAVNMEKSESGFGIEGPATSEGGTI